MVNLAIPKSASKRGEAGWLNEPTARSVRLFNPVRFGSVELGWVQFDFGLRLEGNSSGKGDMI